MCATKDCTANPTGKSKYCDPHKAQARQAWLAMVAAKSGDKEAREKKWADLHAEAYRAGMIAGNKCVPTPMVVEQRANMAASLFGDNDDRTNPVVYREVVMGGVCGFAWVKIGPGNSSFALYLTKKGYGRKSYTGGVQVWVKEFGQSMQAKEAFAQAYAEVIRQAEPSLKVYAQSRMD